jgi:hypothetical protein
MGGGRKSTVYRSPSPVGRGGDTLGDWALPDTGDATERWERPEGDLLRWIPAGDEALASYVSLPAMAMAASDLTYPNQFKQGR